MSLLIKALDKAQAAKAQEAKAFEQAALDAKGSKDAKVQAPADAPHADAATAADSTAKAGNAKSSTNAASEKMAAANALEMELSPLVKPSSVADTSIQDNPDIFSITSTFKLQEPISTSKVYAHKPSPLKAAATKPLLAKTATDKAADSAAAARAANVFAAKQSEENSENAKLALLAGAALLALLAMGVYFYQFADNTPDGMLARRPAPVLTQAATPIAQASNQLAPTNTEQLTPVESAPIILPPANTDKMALKADEVLVNDVQSAKKSSLFETKSVASNSGNSNAEYLSDEVRNDENSLRKGVKQIAQAPAKPLEIEQIASRSASVQVSKNQSQVGVNPVLMDAYRAYSAGNDALASNLYKQVLQRDIRNIDALLGLGAIAQRQGRLLDANGWYGKVLEIEPRNNIAVAAMLESKPQNETMNTESRIKNMLAKQPDDANLYAALGHFYADQNQWSAAQQAYFDAFRLNANADNAFNLGVSLDQLSKPKLALPYYQRALELADTSQSGIDKVALQARIAAIQ